MDSFQFQSLTSQLMTLTSAIQAHNRLIEEQNKILSEQNKLMVGIAKAFLQNPNDLKKPQRKPSDNQPK